MAKKSAKEVVESPKEKKIEKTEEKASTTKKKGKGKIVAIIIALIIIAILIFIFFFLKFKVTFKYNNGEEDKVIKVKFLRKIPPSEVRDDLIYDGHEFVGYFETYYLSGKEIDTIKNDSTKEESICKEGFKLDSEKVKCVAEKEFDFNNTRIKCEKTIEALWNGVKETPKPTPKPKPAKDNGNISLSASNSCIIGSSSVTVTANVKNAKDSTINWSSDSCLTLSGSGNSRTVTANNCSGSATVTAKLKNGSTASVKLTSEQELSVTLIDYENNTPPFYYEGYYYGVKTIQTNIPAVITGTLLDESSAARTEAHTSAGVDGSVTVKTPCGQTKNYSLKAVIN